MSKELNIIEAVNMPIGTEFEMIRDGKKERVFLKKDDPEFGQDDILFTDKEDLDSEDTGYFIAYKNFINAKFIPIQKPVSFMEAIEAYKNGSDIKVKLNGTFRKYKRSDKALIDKDSQPINCYEILDGEWYIEED